MNAVLAGIIAASSLLISGGVYSNANKPITLCYAGKPIVVTYSYLYPALKAGATLPPCR